MAFLQRVIGHFGKLQYNAFVALGIAGGPTAPGALWVQLEGAVA